MVIPFNKPFVPLKAEKYIKQTFASGKMAGDHDFTNKCNSWIEKHTGTKKALLTTSCTHALEMAAILMGIKEGDEVIMPSYTFTSTANAFILRGARIVFVDIRPDTMNIDEKLIAPAITRKTRIIVPVHYAGVGCEMDTIMALGEKHALLVVEDAAQGLMAAYKNKMLGTFGDLGCYSFHETKNYQCGEGGALLLNSARFIRDAEIIREKGTNRSQFFRGEVDKYNWQKMGSSYLPSDMNAALLYAQLEMADRINRARLRIWHQYYRDLKGLELKGDVELPCIPAGCDHNAHMFYIKVKDLSTRSKLIQYLKQKGIKALFHYVPLHSSAAGKKYGRFNGRDRFTTTESERLLRLPLFCGMSQAQVERVAKTIVKYFVKGG